MKMYKPTKRDFKEFIRENPFVLDASDLTLMHSISIEMMLWLVWKGRINEDIHTEMSKLDILNGIKKIIEAI